MGGAKACRSVLVCGSFVFVERRWCRGGCAKFFFSVQFGDHIWWTIGAGRVGCGVVVDPKHTWLLCIEWAYCLCMDNHKPLRSWRSVYGEERYSSIHFYLYIRWKWVVSFTLLPRFIHWRGGCILNLEAYCLLPNS